MTLPLTVKSITAATDAISGFCLAAADGRILPAWSAGAHIQLHLPLANGLVRRAYSLIDLSGDTAGGGTEYRIAVRREESGRGGSRFMHESVNVGDSLQVEPPQNDFPLDPHDDIVLLAGGIGVTPILSMAACLSKVGARYTAHYSGRDAAALAYVDEFRALAGERLSLHADNAASALDIAALLRRYVPSQHIYVCGPKGMLDALLAAARAAGWADDHLHFELFSEAARQSGDAAFTVVLKQSGRELVVAADKTLLDTLIEAGLDPMFDCRRGECGVCACTVIEGEVDHRDYCQSDAEKAANTSIQTCVSRARGARLVIDL